MPMKYVYAALLLHSWAQPVNEENVKKIVSAAGGQAEESQVKALVAALSEVNIDDALKSASSMMMAPAAAPAAPSAEGKKKSLQKTTRRRKRKPWLDWALSSDRMEVCGIAPHGVLESRFF